MDTQKLLQDRNLQRPLGNQAEVRAAQEWTSASRDPDVPRRTARTVATRTAVCFTSA